jgi:SAM-dependent methyltransferase
MLDSELLAWVRAELPDPPARVLEVGAGEGELAAALRGDGYEVLAIDPGSDANGVERLALAELEPPPDGFDAAVAVVSLHHVEPLAGSLAALARALRPRSRLLVDEFDSDEFDERAAAWLIERREDDGQEGHHGHETHDDPAELVANVRAHVHSVATIRTELSAAGFELEAAVAGAYLHRWDLPPGHAAGELGAIEAGDLPAVGRRFAAIRR